MARTVTPRRKLITTLAAWTVALIIFFPVLWMILTSFKTEASAVASPPQLFTADWTLVESHLQHTYRAILAITASRPAAQLEVAT